MSDDPLVCPKRTPADYPTSDRHYVPDSAPRPQVCTHAGTLDATLDALRRRFAELERANSALRAQALGLTKEMGEVYEELREVVCTLGDEVLPMLPTSLAQRLSAGPLDDAGRLQVLRRTPALDDLLTWLLGYVVARAPVEAAADDLFDARTFHSAVANVEHYLNVMQREFNGCRTSRERLRRAGEPPISQKAQSEPCAES